MVATSASPWAPGRLHPRVPPVGTEHVERADGTARRRMGRQWTEWNPPASAKGVNRGPAKV